MSRKTIIPVFTPQDEEKARPILEALKARGILSDAGKASKKNAHAARAAASSTRSTSSRRATPAA